MDQCRVQLVNLPPTLQYAIAIVEDCPVNARVVDNATANIVSWTKGVLQCNGPDAVADHHW